MDKATAYSLATNYIDFLINDKKYEIKKAYLFGSYAKKKQHKDSDIDIAVVLSNVIDIFDLQVQLMLLRRNFSIDIEPHPIKEEDFIELNPIAYEIMKTGLELPLPH